MWEARDADSRVVLFGSVHGLPEGVAWRTPLLDGLLSSSEAVYFETDIGPLGMAALTVRLFVASLQGPAEPWTLRLDVVERERLETALEAVGLTLGQVERLPPWVVSLQLTQLAMTAGDEDEALAFDRGVDFILQWELAKERKAYFETPGQQFDMLAGGTLDEQIVQLLMTLDEIDQGAGAMADLVDAWEDGDVDFIAAQTVPGSPAEEQAFATLLTARNRNWIPAIEAMLAEDRETLIVVGAAHLAGEASVLDLLRQAGYTVNRIQ